MSRSVDFAVKACFRTAPKQVNQVLYKAAELIHDNHYEHSISQMPNPDSITNFTAGGASERDCHTITTVLTESFCV